MTTTMTILRQFEFRVPFLPKTKKNNYKPRKRQSDPPADMHVAFRKANGSYGGKPFFDATKDEGRAMAALFAAQMSRLGHDMIPQDHAVSVEFSVHDGPTEADRYVMVYVFDLGKRRMSGRRGIGPDLDGVLTSCLDAMKRVVFSDDLQVQKLSAVKRFPGDPSQPWVPTERELREAT